MAYFTATDNASEQTHELSFLRNGASVLAVPSVEVFGVQSSNLVETKGSLLPLAVGSVITNGRHWPVFGLSENFNLLDEMLSNEGSCICLSDDKGESGLALICDNFISNATNSNLQWEELPKCMKVDSTPVPYWVRSGNRIIPITSTASITNYLKLRMERGS